MIDSDNSDRPVSPVSSQSSGTYFKRLYPYIYIRVMNNLFYKFRSLLYSIEIGFWKKSN